MKRLCKFQKSIQELPAVLSWIFSGYSLFRHNACNIIQLLSGLLQSLVSSSTNNLTSLLKVMILIRKKRCSGFRFIYPIKADMVQLFLRFQPGVANILQSIINIPAPHPDFIGCCMLLIIQPTAEFYYLPLNHHFRFRYREGKDKSCKRVFSLHKIPLIIFWKILLCKIPQLKNINSHLRCCNLFAGLAQDLHAHNHKTCSGRKR